MGMVFDIFLHAMFLREGQEARNLQRRESRILVWLSCSLHESFRRFESFFKGVFVAHGWAFVDSGLVFEHFQHHQLSLSCNFRIVPEFTAEAKKFILRQSHDSSVGWCCVVVKVKMAGDK